MYMITVHYDAGWVTRVIRRTMKGLNEPRFRAVLMYRYSCFLSLFKMYLTLGTTELLACCKLPIGKPLSCILYPHWLSECTAKKSGIFFEMLPSMCMVDNLFIYSSLLDFSSRVTHFVFIFAVCYLRPQKKSF